MAEGGSNTHWKIAAGLGCGMLLVSGLACAYGFSQFANWFQEDIREQVHQTACAGGVTLTVEYARTRNNFEGVTSNQRIEGRYGEQRYGAATFVMDGEPTPEFYSWNPTQHREHGEGEAALHVFVSGPGLDRATEQAIEACVEADAPALLAALDASEFSASRGGSWAGRRRVYWSGAAEDLEPEFRDGERVLRLERDGAIARIEPWGAGGTSETLLGYVRGTPERPRIEWTSGARDDADLARFVDGEGQTLLGRLGVTADER